MDDKLHHFVPTLKYIFLTISSAYFTQITYYQDVNMWLKIFATVATIFIAIITYRKLKKDMIYMDMKIKEKQLDLVIKQMEIDNLHKKKKDA